MSRRQLLGAAALFAVGLVLIGIGRFFRGVDEADIPTAPAPSSDGATPAPNVDPASPDHAAEARHFHQHSKSKTFETLAALPARFEPEVGAVWQRRIGANFDLKSGTGEALASLGVEGRRQTTVYRVTKEAVLIGYSHELKVTKDGQRMATLENEMRAEILVAFDRRARVTHVGLPRDISAEARNLQRSLLALAEFVLPPKEGAAAWEERGTDPAGEFVDRYSAKPKSVGRERTYSRLRGSDAKGVSAEGKGIAWADPGPGGVNTYLHSSTTINLTTGGRTLVFESRLALRPPNVFPGIGQGTEARLAVVEASLGATPWTAGLAHEAGGLSAKPPPPLEDVLADLARAGRGENFREQAPRMFLDLVRRLRVDEDAVEPTLAALRDTSLPLDVRSTILDGLGEAGTARTQLALVGLLDEDLPDDLLPSLFLALGAARQPLPEAVKALEDQGYAGDPTRSRDPRRAAWATRATGILAGHAADLELVDTLAKTLVSALGPDPKADLVILEALGNAGREVSLTAVERYLTAKEDALRAAAVAALRKFDPARVEALVVERVKTDSSQEVRREAVRTLGDLSPVRAGVRAGALAALKDPVPEVRRQAVTVIGGWLGFPTLASADRDALVGALRAVAQGDPDADVQAAAREALQ